MAHFFSINFKRAPTLSLSLTETQRHSHHGSEFVAKNMAIVRGIFWQIHFRLWSLGNNAATPLHSARLIEYGSSFSMDFWLTGKWNCEWCDLDSFSVVAIPGACHASSNCDCVSNIQESSLIIVWNCLRFRLTRTPLVGSVCARARFIAKNVDWFFRTENDLKFKWRQWNCRTHHHRMHNISAVIVWVFLFFFSIDGMDNKPIRHMAAHTNSSFIAFNQEGQQQQNQSSQKQFN